MARRRILSSLELRSVPIIATAEVRSDIIRAIVDCLGGGERHLQMMYKCLLCVKKLDLMCKIIRISVKLA
jgi:hypothetical protein